MMPGSDDETVEVGVNEERRLCRLARDDDQDDLREDAEELFGHSAQAPIDVDDGQEVRAANDEEGEEDENSAKRSRPSTSIVWLDFKLFKKVNGKKVRYAAKCIHCSKQYSALSSGGTGHLIRHRDKFPRRGPSRARAAACARCAARAVRCGPCGEFVFFFQGISK